MAQKKLLRFAELKTFSNVLEYPDNMRGSWKGFFGNEHPLVLELACGRGEYTVGLSRMYPQSNHIGVDIKGNRMFIGARQCLLEKLANAAFLRTQIEKLTDYFAPGEVDQIWITFPDPQLRPSKAKKRLTHPRFLRLYKQILKENGVIHLKTDSPALYDFTKKVIELYGLQVLEDSNNIYASQALRPELRLRTHYENLDIAQSRRIHYLQFSLSAGISDNDEKLFDWIKNEEQTH